MGMWHNPMRTSNHHRISLAGLVVVLFSLAGATCSRPPGDDVGDGGTIDDGQFVVPALRDAEVPPFSVVVTADRGTGIPGTRFALTALVNANDSPPRSFSWSVDGAAPSAFGPVVELSFAQPGDYDVVVTVEDEQGQTASEGTLLKVFDPAATPPARTPSIAPDSGMAGVLVRIESPTLNDASAHIELQVGNGTPFEPYRPELGVATFLIPLNAADGLMQATAITIHILANDQDVAQFAFTLSPLPSLTGAPGDLTRQFMESGPGLINQVESSMLGIFDGLQYDLTAEQRALAQSLLHLAKARFEQVRAALGPVLDQLDTDSLAALDRILTANGIDAALLDNLSTSAKAIRLNKNTNDHIIDLLCEFHDLIAQLQEAIGAATNASAALPFLAVLGAGTPIAPAVIAAAGLVAQLGLVDDILGELDGMVPSVQDTLDVTADPNHLREVGEKSVLQITAHLANKIEICEKAITKILEELANRTVERLLKRIPFARLAGIVKRGNPSLDGATSDEITKYIKDSVNQLAQTLVGTDRLGQILEDLKKNLCALDFRRDLRLQPEQAIIKLPAQGGSLLNLQDESIDFYCLRQEGAVQIRVERECGLADRNGKIKKLTGETKVRCFKEECTENALGSLVFAPRFRQGGPRDNFCTLVKNQLELRTVEVFVTNTHPSRTIAIAAVVLAESDQTGPYPAPCADPGLSLTVEDCIDHVTAGCNTPPGLFIEPGKTAAYPILYNCLVENNYPSSGACSDMVLETVRAHVLAQAVFCDDYDTAQERFCSQVNRPLVQIGLPWPGLPHQEVHECP